MARYLLIRKGSVFTGVKYNGVGWGSFEVFRVSGPEAARAAIRLLGVVTPIQDSFFNDSGEIEYHVSIEAYSDSSLERPPI